MCRPSGTSKYGSSFVDWKQDDIIILQIFSGPTEAGHWSCAIIDRTRGDRKHVVVYLDSLPTSAPQAKEELRSSLLRFGIIDSSTPWITADVPRQGIGSNDCGVFMCCLSALYIEALEKELLLHQQQLPSANNRTPHLKGVQAGG